MTKMRREKNSKRIQYFMVILLAGLGVMLCHAAAMAAIPQIAAGNGHTVALKEDGTVWAWGDNSDGQLGDGTGQSRYVPMQVAGLTNVIAVAAGGWHTVALKADGTVWTWGSNRWGQLGDGGAVDTRYVPEQIAGLTNVMAVAAGGDHTVALKADGTVWAWGSNGWGQMGNGSVGDKHLPMQITGLANIAAVAAGSGHTVVLKEDGTVWACGNNDWGQLGGGDTTLSRYTPVQASGVDNVKAVAAGGLYTVGLKVDGTVWSWGCFYYEDWSAIASGNLPMPASGLANVAAVSAGWAHNVALKMDGTVWAWGDNNYGQLGDGTPYSYIRYYTPGQVSGLTNVTAVEAGTWHTVALKADGRCGPGGIMTMGSWVTALST